MQRPSRAVCKKKSQKAISDESRHPIPKTAKEAYEMGYLDSGGEFQEDATGPSTVVRNGYFDFEADGGAPHLRVPYTAQITFGIPLQILSTRRSNVIVMPLRKES